MKLGEINRRTGGIEDFNDGIGGSVHVSGEEHALPSGEERGEDGEEEEEDGEESVTLRRLATPHDDGWHG